MRQRLFVILNLSLVSGCVILGVSIISPILPQYALSFSIPVALVGWAVSAFALARVVMDIPAGLLADRFGRKKIMILGLVLIILSATGAGLADTYAWLIFARIVGGIGSALYMTAGITWVVQVTAGKARGRYMSLYTGLVLAGTILGPTIGGYTAARFGLNAPFFAWAALGIAGLIATIPLKEPADSSQAAIHAEDVLSVLKNRPFMLVNCAVLALFFLRIGVRSTLVPLYASLNLGLSEERIGILLTVAAVATVACTFPAGWLSDRVGRKRPVMACLFLSGIIVLFIPSQGSLGGLMGVMALYGLVSGLQGSMAAWPADVAPKGKLGTSMGVYRVMGDIGMFLGPITVTYIADYTGDLTVTFMPFLAPAILVFVVGVLMIWARDPARRRHADEVMIE
ncbi:MAG: MFS transporter [Dehalococcoidia bacterium]|jgi:MFS family permease